MAWQLSKLAPRSAPAVLLVLLFAAMAAFAAVKHLVTRYNANQQARARRLYSQGVVDQRAGNLNAAVDDFRAALTGDPENSQYQLALGRALRDTGDPRQLEEARTYLEDLWQRAPEDGTINLALARVAARRGSIEDALRYYHNAMYGVWNSDPEGNRRRARLELIEFLLQKNARVEAQPELMALAATLPTDPALRLEIAQLFAQDQDNRDALAQYEHVLRIEHGNATAMAGAGDAAFHLGRYRTAEKYLKMSVEAEPHNATARAQLDSANAVLAANPFERRISDAERNRRIKKAWIVAGDRLKTCSQSMAANQTSPAIVPAKNSPVAPIANEQSAPDSFTDLQNRWLDMKAEIPRLRSPAETDLPDTIMDLVFEIEQQTAPKCGEPQGVDSALLLISRDREAADQ